MDGESFAEVRNHLNLLGCTQTFGSLEEIAQERLSPEDRTILALSQGKIIRRSVKLYWENFRTFVGCSSILWVPLMVAAAFPSQKPPPYSVAYVLFAAVTVYLLSQLAYEQLILASSDRLLGREPRFVETWRRVSIRGLLEFAWTTILVGVMVTAGVLLLVIPGIIWGIRLAVSGPVAVVERKTGTAAIRRSFQISRGHGGTIFGTLFGVSLLIGLAELPIRVAGTYLGQGWGVDPQTAAWYANLTANTITTPLMAIAVTALYYHIRGLSLKHTLTEAARTSSHRELSGRGRMPGMVSGSEAPHEDRRLSAMSEEVSEKGFVPTILLCFFLGVLGIHRFYVGKIGTGILQLVTFGGLGIWTLIDLVVIVMGNFNDAQGRPIPAP